MHGKAVPKPFAKPRIAIVGAGNLAHALASSLHEAGYVIDQIVSRARAESLRRAKQLAATLGSSAVTTADVQIHAEVVWFCVPDRSIASCAKALRLTANWAGRVALHSSGALSSAELLVLQERGAAVASVHPMMTFVRGSQPSLAGVPFAVEGDAKAARMARRIVADLGGEVYSIRRKDKSAYHAWGTFISPLLVALLATSEHVAAQAGVKGNAARRRMLPILRQTLANYAEFGAAGAFSGPLVRGDVEIIERHLRVLRGSDQTAYLSLARSALAYLLVRNRAMIEKTLQSFEKRRGRG